MRPVEPNETKWGRRGSKIENSVYVRDFCRLCSDPIRVTKIEIGNASPACSQCKDRDTAFLACGSWNKQAWLTDRAYHGRFYD